MGQYISHSSTKDVEDQQQDDITKMKNRLRNQAILTNNNNNSTAAISDDHTPSTNFPSSFSLRPIRRQESSKNSTSTTIFITNADEIPDDIFFTIFEFLDSKILNRDVRFVNKRFNTLCDLSNHSFIFSQEGGIDIQALISFLTSNSALSERLFHIDITRLKLSDSDLKQIVSHCTKLKSLTLNYCNCLTVSAVDHLRSYAQHLEVIDISNMRIPYTQFADRWLKYGNSLKELRLSGYLPSNLLEYCQQLRTLVVYRSDFLNNPSSEIRIESLHTLALVEHSTSPQVFLSHLSELYPNLKTLVLDSRHDSIDTSKIVNLPLEELVIYSRSHYALDPTPIASMTTLKKLTLRSITRQEVILFSFKNFVNILPQLTTINIAYQQGRINDMTILGQYCRELKELTIDGANIHIMPVLEGVGHQLRILRISGAVGVKSTRLFSLLPRVYFLELSHSQFDELSQFPAVINNMNSHSVETITFAGSNICASTVKALVEYVYRSNSVRLLDVSACASVSEDMSWKEVMACSNTCKKARCSFLHGKGRFLNRFHQYEQFFKA